MRDWLGALHDAVARGGTVVRVVVATVRGSAPREAGASMIVTVDRELGTIGGGHLELVATRAARGMLAAGADATRHDRFPLAASLGQCCGGIVELWFERYGPEDEPRLVQALRLREGNADPASIAAVACRDPRAARYETFTPQLTPLWLFGAGHVGRALVNVLAELPFAITWVDSRDVIPAAPAGGMGRDPVSRVHCLDPADEVAHMPAGAWALVMTHSHDEDLAICEALLRDGRFGWAGVIGSQPKTQRFRQKLAQRGLASERLTMPIGIGGITSKEPAAIAVAVAAQLLQVREARVASTETRSQAAP